MAKALKDLRLKLDEALHQAVKILAEHEQATIEKWVIALVRREVTRHVAVATRLSAAITIKDLIEQLPTSKDEPPTLYFIQRGDDGPIKIGVAKDLQRRLRSLQTGCAEPLRVLAAVPALGDVSERALHRRFRSLRQEGEWFSPDAELLRFAAALAQPSTNSREGGEE